MVVENTGPVGDPAVAGYPGLPTLGVETQAEVTEDQLQQDQPGVRTRHVTTMAQLGDYKSLVINGTNN